MDSIQGLRENRLQFGLLVLVNAFVGFMVGLERSVLPEFAESRFGLTAGVALVTFIMAFGLSKSLANLLMTHLTAAYTRKQILVAGWMLALPVPFLLMYAQGWWMVVLANIFLGLNQGLAWSSTVIMKVDLVGRRNRGLAMGINDFAGYLAVGVAAYLSSEIASSFGATYYPFLPGVFAVAAGLLISLLFVRDTTRFTHKEAESSTTPLLDNVWAGVSWKHQNLGTVTWNGWINNLNDGVIWVLLPVWLSRQDYSILEVGMVAGLYPIVWGVGQLFTGKIGDHLCKKQMISLGMWTQALGLLLLVIIPEFWASLTASLLLGMGTAMVYPNFLTTVAENTHPSQRAHALSVFRFWRDSGYVFGALPAALLTESLGIPATFIITALLTATGGFLAHHRMCCTLKSLWRTTPCPEPY